jgi:hypothetical protein
VNSDDLSNLFELIKEAENLCERYPELEKSILFAKRRLELNHQETLLKSRLTNFDINEVKKSIENIISMNLQNEEPGVRNLKKQLKKSV